MSKRSKSRMVNKGERERLRRRKEAEQRELEEFREEILEKESAVQEPEEILEEESAMQEPQEEFGKEFDVPSPVPTTFAELDEMREAEEKAQRVSHVTYDTQDLVFNILHSYDLEPTEKADRIMDVADGFAERVNAVMNGEEMEKDLDQLKAEAILATYHRSLNPIQKARDWAEDVIVKRELTYKKRKRLEDDDFALPSKRKYPIHDKAHTRNALARAAQMIARGGEAAADAKAALPRIREAAKKFGIEVSKGAILIEKDKAGEWRWIGKPSNNFKDRQGDIIRKSAHEEYARFLDGNEDMAPKFLVWHTPGTAREHAADFWMEHEGALIMSGKLTEREAAALLKAQSKYDLGMSVQGMALRDPQDRDVIEHYWLYEVSDLPLERAANPFTSLETIAKEAGMDKLQYLTEMMGSEEEAKRFLDRVEKNQKELAEAGFTHKAQEEAGGPEAREEPKKEAGLDVDALTKQIVEAVGKELDIEGLNAFVAKAQENSEKVEFLERALKDVLKAKEEEMADMLTPPIRRWNWSQMNRPSAREDTLLKDDDETDRNLRKANPGVPADYWLSEVTGTVPVEG